MNPEKNQGWGINWPAPAKINRFLHIIGTREDGYHLIQSVFQFIGFHDELTFHKSKNNKLEFISNFHEIDDSKNIIVKAVEALQLKIQNSIAVKIQLNKKLPSGAVLGGGSSDAATTLLALNYLFHLKLSLDDLCEIGMSLGADVPFFIAGNNAFVEGIGEKMTALNIDTPYYLLQIPPCLISTKKIFQDPCLQRHTASIKLNELQSKENKINKFIELRDYGHNDCESVVLSKYPEVVKAMDWIRPFNSAKMTGTGSCVFSMFDNATEAGKIALRCPDSIQCLVTKGLQYSPVHQMIKSLQSNPEH